MARGYLWFEELATGAITSIAGIAAREGVTPSYVSRLLPLAFLSPEIVERILDGRQPVALTVEAMTRSAGVPSSWPQQRRQLRL
ncbi:MAG: hypothetical protein AB7O45_04035 [Alphaproteobacteria bacterium]